MKINWNSKWIARRNSAHLTYTDYFRAANQYHPLSSTSIDIFTRKEFIIAQLIKQGATIKDIAELYHQDGKSLKRILSSIAGKARYPVNHKWL